jgi:hypothetical protein
MKQTGCNLFEALKNTPRTCQIRLAWFFIIFTVLMIVLSNVRASGYDDALFASQAAHRRVAIAESNHRMATTAVYGSMAALVVCPAKAVTCLAAVPAAAGAVRNMRTHDLLVADARANASNADRRLLNVVSGSNGGSSPTGRTFFWSRV